jgi:tRNA dimethylallyltransferase
MEKENFFVVITGPTGVGKTDFVESLTERMSCNIEVVNADMGQFYKPLTIGTAKPPLKKMEVPYHLFDILEEPCNFTVMEFRKRAAVCFKEIWSRGNVPVVVGGSGFYIKSLFFVPCELKGEKSRVARESEHTSTEKLWEELAHFDPERARQIHPHDRYRIQRALEIWYTFGIRPSECKPRFAPVGRCALYYITRERKELYERIDKRVGQMFKEGWLEEVKHLELQWRAFLKEKKLLGYPEVLEVLAGKLKEVDAQKLIAQKTRNYAKRQLIFWRALKKELEAYDPGRCIVTTREVNLTLSTTELYVDQLIKELLAGKEKNYGTKER